MAEKDKWDEFHIVAQIIGVILIPIVLAIVGYFIEKENRRSNTEIAAQNSREYRRTYLQTSKKNDFEKKIKQVEFILKHPVIFYGKELDDKQVFDRDEALTSFLMSDSVPFKTISEIQTKLISPDVEHSLSKQQGQFGYSLNGSLKIYISDVSGGGEHSIILVNNKDHYTFKRETIPCVQKLSDIYSIRVNAMSSNETKMLDFTILKNVSIENRTENSLPVCPQE